MQLAPRYLPIKDDLVHFFGQNQPNLGQKRRQDLIRVALAVIRRLDQGTCLEQTPVDHLAQIAEEQVQHSLREAPQSLAQQKRATRGLHGVHGNEMVRLVTRAMVLLLSF